MHSVDLTVLGGLPIRVAYSIEPADMSVGIWGGSVDDWEVTHIAGKPVKKCDWLYKRLEANQNEIDRILEKCGEHYHEVQTGFDEPY